MLELSQETIKAVSISITNQASLERSDSELFKLAFQEYKKVAKGSRGHVTNLLNVLVGTYTKSDNIKEARKKVFKLAFNYVDMQVIAMFDNLEYTNIGNLVKLFKYVDKHIPTKSLELRTSIKSLYEDDMSPHRYNNVVASKITELKEEYKLKDVEGEFVFTESLDIIKGMLTHMTEGQVLELLQVVQDKFDRVEIVGNQPASVVQEAA